MGIINASNAVVPYFWEQRQRLDREHLVERGVPVAAARAVRRCRKTRRRRRSRREGYGMTKWMVIRQTRQMAQLLGSRDIRVNAVCPGVTMSPATKAVVPEPIVDALVGDVALLNSTLEPEDMTGVIAVPRVGRELEDDRPGAHQRRRHRVLGLAGAVGNVGDGKARRSGSQRRAIFDTLRAMQQGLAALRVVDFSSGIPGAYCCRLLADAGADVVKVEAPEGDPWRSWSAGGGPIDPAEGGALFRFLHHGVRSVVGSPDAPEIVELLATADVVVDGTPTRDRRAPAPRDVPGPGDLLDHAVRDGGAVRGAAGQRVHRAGRVGRPGRARVGPSGPVPGGRPHE